MRKLAHGGREGAFALRRRRPLGVRCVGDGRHRMVPEAPEKASAPRFASPISRSSRGHATALRHKLALMRILLDYGQAMRPRRAPCEEAATFVRAHRLSARPATRCRARCWNAIRRACRWTSGTRAWWPFLPAVSPTSPRHTSFLAPPPPHPHLPDACFLVCTPPPSPFRSHKPGPRGSPLPPFRPLCHSQLPAISFAGTPTSVNAR